MRVVTACRGRFGAGDGVVAGVVAADPAKAAEGIRAGVVRDGDRWVVHKLDDDVRASVNTVLDSWPPGTKGRAEDAPILCNPAPGRGRELQFGPGNKPRFDLAKAGLRQQTIACFATSDVYNNWDCLVFNPSRRRFVLWYRQTHAD